MIRLNKKIGIIYSGKSKNYAEKLKKIIIDYRTNGYYIEPIMIDSSFLAQEQDIELKIFNNLSKCDYAFVFFTKDLYVESDKVFLSKPNVILELGYLKGRLKENSIWIILDFPYDDIKGNKYMIPSDIPAVDFKEINVKNSNNGLKEIFKNFLVIMKDDIIKVNNYDANNLVDSLILNSSYKTNYKTLFSEKQFEVIEKYSEEWQLREIFNMWLYEKSALSNEEQIIYIFEKIVFLPFFSETVIGGRLIDFLSVDFTDENQYIIISCRKIVESIITYEENKRKRKSYESDIFYNNIAEMILTELSKITSENRVAPIIECVSKNYIGLCYLNASLKICDVENLKLAKANFQQVIELSNGDLGDSMDVFQAFAQYNLARVKRYLSENAEIEYAIAIRKRGELSKISKFPRMFRFNFALERIYAEIDFYDYMLTTNKINISNYMSKIESLQNELSEIGKTPLLYVSLFKTLENKLKQILEDLKIDIT